MKYTSLCPAPAISEAFNQEPQAFLDFDKLGYDYGSILHIAMNVRPRNGLRESSPSSKNSYSLM
jgi:hypothetical protein